MLLGKRALSLHYLLFRPNVVGKDILNPHLASKPTTDLQTKYNESRPLPMRDENKRCGVWPPRVAYKGMIQFLPPRHNEFWHKEGVAVSPTIRTNVE